MLRKLINIIPEHIKVLLKIYVLSMLFFSCFRVLFFFINQPTNIHEVPLSEKLLAFRMGFEFDSPTILWILALPILLLSILYLVKKIKAIAVKIIFYVFLTLFTLYLFVHTANIPYYTQFGSLLNKNALLWNDDSGFILKMVFGSFSYWGYIFIFIVAELLFVFFARKACKQYLFKLQGTTVYPNFLARLFITLVLFFVTFIGIRGRTSFKSPLHEGLAIVGNNAFVNQLALNPNYTFWKSLFYKNNSDRYIVPKKINDYFKYIKNYLGSSDTSVYGIARYQKADSTMPEKNYNVIVVIMESMSVFKMGYYNGKNLTPNLHALNKESVFCENFFSSGIHTFNGLFSTVSGYPAILAERSTREYLRKPFKGIGTLLKQEGYDTYFYTTHDPYFDNMKGFYTLNGFNHFTTQFDFDSDDALSNLGVPDHVLLNRLIEAHQTTSKPFLAVVMTASDHGPWVVPENIPFKPSSTNEKERCTQYADWAIGEFMKKAKQQKWYNNTVFVFLGDHGLSMGHTYEMPISFNHIPCIIHCPQLLKPDTIKTPAYQPDITATVMGLLNKPFVNETFGENILKTKRPFVYFSADDKMGCVYDKGFYYYHLLSNNLKYLRKYKNLDTVNYINTNKTIADSLSYGANSVLESARYLIRENNYSR